MGWGLGKYKLMDLKSLTPEVLVYKVPTYRTLSMAQHASGKMDDV